MEDRTFFNSGAWVWFSYYWGWMIVWLLKTSDCLKLKKLQLEWRPKNAKEWSKKFKSKNSEKNFWKKAQISSQIKIKIQILVLAWARDKFLWVDPIHDSSFEIRVNWTQIKKNKKTKIKIFTNQSCWKIFSIIFECLT